ncbi:TIGR02710 family CRISPR-associated protein [Candidatus Poribacteria bacterium]|nr:TIGR02710 family CRISPR-associated protein [Candidatus Poribacteria bacterium]
MKATLILSVGTSAEPLIKAVEEAGEEVEEVFLVYGRPFEGQTPSPFDVAYELKRHSQERGLNVRTFEVPDPEDFNLCLKISKEALDAAKESEMIVVNYTGGTKSLSAALAHAALSTEIAGELIFEYVGGKRDRNGRVIGKEMKIKRISNTLTVEISHRIVNLLSEANYAAAFYLSERLPETGWAGFLKRATEALWLWDNFDYEPATAIIRDELQQNAQVFLDHDLLSPIAETIVRLARTSRPLRKSVPMLKKLSAKDRNQTDLPETEAMSLICADTLENAQRRMRQGRATDAVLRAYRAVEVAVQGKLMSMGINPWLPNWDAIDTEALKRFQERMGYLPNDIALSAGICLIESISGQTLDERKNDMLKDLLRSRNMSYLEHGYTRLDGETAERLISYAQTLAETVLDVDLKELREKVRHLR